VIGEPSDRARVTMWRQRSAGVQSSLSPIRISVGAVVRTGDAAAGVIEDRGAKPLGEILRAQVAIEGVERGAAAHRLAEHGDARWIDILQRRQVAQRRIGIKGLTKHPPWHALLMPRGLRLSTASAT